ncbi:MAG: hypothetical protein JWM41_4522 [Gemmatimonadetes bacterium]|nr:hypothetical protein [Gemmatimonadota bacterium]
MVRVFVNASGVEVPAGSTALDAVRAWNDDAAREVVAGTRVITDSRGLPIDGGTPMPAGSILRLVAKRDRDAAAEPAAEPADESAVEPAVEPDA